RHPSSSSLERERDDRRERDGCRAGSTSEALEHVRVELAPSITRILHHRHVERQAHDALRIEAWIDRARALQAADEESANDEQHERQGPLRHDERRSQRDATPSTSRAFILERRDDVWTRD